MKWLSALLCLSVGLSAAAVPRHGIHCVRCDDLVFRNLTLKDSGPIMAQACGKIQSPEDVVHYRGPLGRSRPKDEE